MRTDGENRPEALLAGMDAAPADLVVLAVSGTYLQLSSTGARVEAASAQVETSRAIYRQAKDRFDTGLANRVDVNRAQVQLQTEEQPMLPQMMHLPWKHWHETWGLSYNIISRLFVAYKPSNCSEISVYTTS